MRDADQPLARRILDRRASSPVRPRDHELSCARLAGLFAVIASALAVAACLVFVPTLIFKINEIKLQLQMDSQEFNALAENAWQELLKARHLSGGSGHAFRRDPRQANYNTNRGGGGGGVRSYPATNNNNNNDQYNINNAGANRGGSTSNNGGFVDQGYIQPGQCECQTFNRCPAGPPGPPGEPGTPGERGDPGVNGDRGLPGTTPVFDGGYKADEGCRRCPNGVEGSPGSPGTPGKEGAKGEPGRDGTPGASPARGRPGQPGEQGDPGKSGNPGEPGFKGQDGQRGSKGEKGKKGTDGLRGPRGQNGLAGRHGSRGQPGPSGRPGERGNPGTGGNPGFQGNSGVPGLPGTDRGYCNCPPRRNTGNGGVVQPQPYTDRPQLYTDRPAPFTDRPAPFTDRPRVTFTQPQPVYPGDGVHRFPGDDRSGATAVHPQTIPTFQNNYPGDRGVRTQPQPQRSNYPIRGGGGRSSSGAIQPFGGGGRQPQPGRQVIQPQRGNYNDHSASQSRQRSAISPISATIVRRSRFH